MIYDNGNRLHHCPTKIAHATIQAVRVADGGTSLGSHARFSRGQGGNGAPTRGFGRFPPAFFRGFVADTLRRRALTVQCFEDNSRVNELTQLRRGTDERDLRSHHRGNTLDWRSIRNLSSELWRIPEVSR